MFENRRMPNGTSEPSLGLCGVGGRAREGSLYPINKALNRQEILEQTHCHIRLYGIVENGLIVARNLRSRVCLPGLFLQ